MHNWTKWTVSLFSIWYLLISLSKCTISIESLKTYMIWLERSKPWNEIEASFENFWLPEAFWVNLPHWVPQSFFWAQQYPKLSLSDPERPKQPNLLWDGNLHTSHSDCDLENHRRLRMIQKNLRNSVSYYVTVSWEQSVTLDCHLNFQVVRQGFETVWNLIVITTWETSILSHPKVSGNLNTLLWYNRS